MRAPVFLISCLLLAACTPEWQPPEAVAPPAMELPAAIHVLQPAEASAWLEAHAQAQVLDVRTEEELARDGRLPGAVHVDFFHREALERHLATLDKDRPSLICCTLGGRAERVATQLEAQSHTHVHIVRGGLHEWQKSGQILVR